MQKKHSRASQEDLTSSEDEKTFLSTVAEIFPFIGRDPDKAVSKRIFKFFSDVHILRSQRFMKPCCFEHKLVFFGLFEARRFYASVYPVFL